MKGKKVLALLLAGVMGITGLAGCGAKNTETDNAENQGTKAESGAEASTGSSSEEAEVPDVEIWNANIGYKAVEKDGELYNFYKDLIGVGIVQPYVEWNGGNTYQQQLNLKIAAGEMPDMFLPYNGMEKSLIESGSLLDLTDLLPEMAPNLWESVPEEVWDVMRSYDPTGEGRIYTIPNLIDYNLMSGLIRQDWLDNLGLSMPTTQDEFVAVLEAFKMQDPNGNGTADEIPTGGRQEVKWMDTFFAMYGLAMWEGDPQWDIYDGELTYAAVTPNMKDALAFMNELYEKGLMDPETLLNDKAAWEGKIFADKVGVAYHWSETANSWVESIKSATGAEADWAVLPAISAEGYEAFYTTKKIKGIGYVLKNTDDQKTIEAYMKVLNAYGDKDLWKTMYLGVEGMHSHEVNGNLVRKEDDMTVMENIVLAPYNDVATVEFKVDLYKEMSTGGREWAMKQSIRNIEESQKYGKTIAGDGIPSSVYDEYPDIMNKTLYIEYASKIITGEYEIDKFDEFVEKWYATGGEAVTKAAREWYSATQQ